MRLVYHTFCSVRTVSWSVSACPHRVVRSLAAQQLSIDLQKDDIERSVDPFAIITTWLRKLARSCAMIPPTLHIS
jgi:hypothetical protein